MTAQPETIYRLDRRMQPVEHANDDPVPETPAAASEETVPAGPGALPPGWVVLRGCNLSGVPAQPVPVTHVLLHPAIGVALLDADPVALEGAVGALRHRLATARFEAIFPGYLPVATLALPASELPYLATHLAVTFAELPPLSVPGGDGWVSVVRRALEPRDPRLSPAPAAAPLGGVRLVRPRETRVAEIVPDTAPPPPQAGWRRAAALGLGGLAVVGLLGVGAASLLPGEAPPAPAIGQAPAAVPAPDRPPAMAEAAGSPVAGPPAAGPAPKTPAVVEPAAPQPAPPVASLAPPPRPQPPRLTPAVAPAPAPALPRVTVRAAANLRASPDNRGRVLRIVPAGEALHAFGQAPGGWVHVGEAEPQGWIHGKLLRGAGRQ